MGHDFLSTIHSSSQHTASINRLQKQSLLMMPKMSIKKHNL